MRGSCCHGDATSPYPALLVRLFAPQAAAALRMRVEALEAELDASRGGAASEAAAWRRRAEAAEADMEALRAKVRCSSPLSVAQSLA